MLCTAVEILEDVPGLGVNRGVLKGAPEEHGGADGF